MQTEQNLPVAEPNVDWERVGKQLSKWLGQAAIWMMNRKQKTCLWAGIGVIVLMGLFPPWRHSGSNPFLGRHPLWNPPAVHRVGADIDERGNLQRRINYYRPESLRIDITSLCVQWVMVAIITGGLVFTFKDEKDRKPKNEQKE